MKEVGLKIAVINWFGAAVDPKPQGISRDRPSQSVSCDCPTDGEV